MFDKNKFATILKNINDTYSSQRDFSKKSDINRTYLSQYMNVKLESPPKPKILKKLAESSNGVTTYNELMHVCGYINNDFSETDQKKLSSLYEQLSDWDNTYFKDDLRLSIEENRIRHDLFNQVLQYLHDGQTTPVNFNPYEILNDINFISDKSKKRLAEALKRDFEYYYYTRKIKKKISEIQHQSDYNKKNVISKEKKCRYYMCPVYGRIAAGEPNWAEECMEGYLPIDPNLMNIVNPEECFFLRVNGESMNKVIKNGAFALIRKTDWVEDGEIAVVLVNGYDATLKKFKRLKKSGFIMLEPQSNYDEFEPIIIDPKETEIKIIGKYIGKMEMN